MHVSQAMRLSASAYEKFYRHAGKPESTRSNTNLNHINEIARFLGCSPRKFLPEEPL